ncbi:MAG: DUF58 domain-containing protein [Bryobacteraceae bacterium]|nr:DUF58 domain-containing protein [Bryobacteraceae bacterium]
MISKELARKIRYIEIFTNKVVNDVLAGEYHSVFKGRGIEFDEVREYTPGDDVRAIDWNVTARAGRPYVKRFVEERELTVIFLVDLSGSGAFGSRERLKNEVAAEVCALLAFSAIKNNDKVGLVIFTDAIELYIPPKKGASHVLRLIRDVLGFKPRRTGTDIAAALDYLGRVTHRRAVVFLVSDLLAEGFEKRLRIAAKRHDLIAVSITDPRERELPDVGLIDLEDPETGERVVIDAGSPAVRRQYERLGREREARARDLLRAAGVDHIAVTTGRDYVKNLMLFFRARERRQ